MGLFGWLTCSSFDDWELVLYILRIVVPVVTVCLSVTESRFIDLYDRTGSAAIAVVAGLLAVWEHIPREQRQSEQRQREQGPREQGPADDNGIKFHVTSKVDFPLGQKISRKWLVSWKPVPEKCYFTSSDGVRSENMGSSNDDTKIVYFDRDTGMTFDIITSIKPIGTKEQNDGTEMGTTSGNVDDIQDRSDDENKAEQPQKENLETTTKRQIFKNQ